MMKAVFYSITLIMIFFVGCSVVSKVDLYSYSSGQVEVAIERGRVLGVSIVKNEKRTSAITQPIYLKFSDNEEAHLLSEITPDYLSKKYADPMRPFSFIYPEKSIEFSNGAFVSFVFTDSKLVYVSLSGRIPQTAPLIANKKEGPFCEFPLSRKEVKNLFGKPESKRQINRL